jgi:hypothetical protein
VGRPDNVSTQHIPDAFSQTNLRPPTQFPLNPRQRIAGRTDQAVDDFAQSAIQTPCRTPAGTLQRKVGVGETAPGVRVVALAPLPRGW